MGNSDEPQKATNGENKEVEKKDITGETSKYGEYDQLFLRYDLDKDGLLNENEFINLLDHYLVLKPELSDLINEIRNEIKIDQSSPLTQEEFRNLMYNCFTNQDVSERAIEVFKIFDKNAEAELTSIEILHVFNKLGLNMSLEDVELLLEEAVNNRNGKLVFEDFIKIMIAK